MRRIISMILVFVMLVVPGIPTVSYAVTGHVNGCTQNLPDMSCCTKTYNITAKPGYRVVDVIVNGEHLGPITSYQFTNLTGPQEMKVITEKISSNVLPQIEYSAGDDAYEILDDGIDEDGVQNWRIKFKESGTLTFIEGVDKIDVFLVGGGGAGGRGGNDNGGCGGGGGGYTITERSVSVTEATPYAIEIGAGGIGGDSSNTVSTSGGSTNAFGYSAAGGECGGNGYYATPGGAGGSGGGVGCGNGNGNDGAAGIGGTDGGDGLYGNLCGTGQVNTTREFGEDTGKLYAGGGGGGRGSGDQSNNAGEGGGGYGGSGGDRAAANGERNTGGGGGGSAYWNTKAGDGGSGIVVIRNAREIPNLPKIDYDGRYELIDDGIGEDGIQNWRIKFLTSGTLTFIDGVDNIDVFLVGGGGAGGRGGNDNGGCGGGGGGYTTTGRSVSVTEATPYAIEIGAGGIGGDSSNTVSTSGGSTNAFGYSAAGGECGGNGYYATPGGAGGSGGGVGCGNGNENDGAAGIGGTDGGDGLYGNLCGTGQVNTTREFGEDTGKLYAGGGGGGRGSGDQSNNAGEGGGGYGGSGGDRAAANGERNTGGGGGGSGYWNTKAGDGGSGIVVIRNARCVVDYNLNGGNGIILSQRATSGSTITLSSTIPTRANYEFLGWSTSRTATVAQYMPGQTYAVNADVTLYAVWSTTMPSFSYTGQYEVIDDGIVDGQQNWRIKFLTSGDLTFIDGVDAVDLFLVGGGGGASSADVVSDGGGGGGGYTATYTTVPVEANMVYSIVIGEGGTYQNAGGASSAFGLSADGGKVGEKYKGGDGGSGGGGFAKNGGSDGSVGESDKVFGDWGSGGAGQVYTTREFGAIVTSTYIVGATEFASDWLSLTSGGSALTPVEGTIYSVMNEGEYWYRDFIWNGSSYEETDIARVYAGGGGGGDKEFDPAVGKGGAGGGGDDGQNGAPNTGGGAGCTRDGITVGGTGIVIIRNARAPEGTPPDIASIPVGAYIDYTPTADIASIANNYTGNGDSTTVQELTIDKNNDTKMKWKVFNNNSGQIDIISEESVGNLTLNGNTGYLNAVYALHTLCGQYVNANNAISARSLGSSLTANTGIISTDSTENVYATVPYTDASYESDLEVINREINGEYPLKHTSGDVWLASREVAFADGWIRTVRRMTSDGDLVDSTDGTGKLSYWGNTSLSYSATYGVRPIVRLNPNIAIIGGTGTEYNPYKISDVLPKFNYTGDYEIEVAENGYDWKIRFLTDGELTFTSLANAADGIDIFLVGGGGGGQAGYASTSSNSGAPGGGGGYTTTVRNAEVSQGITYTIDIGEGGTGDGAGEIANGKPSSISQIQGAIAEGGYSGANGGHGGSAGYGYSDGKKCNNNCEICRGTTTSEFGEGGTLYSGGGGAVGYYPWTDGIANPGGAGGGGASSSAGGVSTPGKANTGGGGGSGMNGVEVASWANVGANGGSGIIIIRNARAQ